MASREITVKFQESVVITDYYCDACSTLIPRGSPYFRLYVVGKSLKLPDTNRVGFQFCENKRCRPHLWAHIGG